MIPYSIVTNLRYHHVAYYLNKEVNDALWMTELRLYRISSQAKDAVIKYEKSRDGSVFAAVSI